MKKQFDYAHEAEKCLAAAEKATNDDSRHFLTAMARVWSHLAGTASDLDTTQAPRPDAKPRREGRLFT